MFDKKPRNLSWALDGEKESGIWGKSVPTLHKEGAAYTALEENGFETAQVEQASRARSLRTKGKEFTFRFHCSGKLLKCFKQRNGVHLDF